MPRGCLEGNSGGTKKMFFWILDPGKEQNVSTDMKVVLDPSTDMKVVLDPRIQFLKPPTRVVPLCSRRVGRWGHACLGRSQNGDVPPSINSDVAMR